MVFLNLDSENSKVRIFLSLGQTSLSTRTKCFARSLRLRSYRSAAWHCRPAQAQALERPGRRGQQTEHGRQAPTSIRLQICQGAPSTDRTGARGQPRSWATLHLEREPHSTYLAGVQAEGRGACPAAQDAGQDASRQPHTYAWVADSAEAHRGGPVLAAQRGQRVSQPARASLGGGLTHLEVGNVHLFPDSELLAQEPRSGHAVEDRAVELPQGQG